MGYPAAAIEAPCPAPGIATADGVAGAPGMPAPCGPPPCIPAIALPAGIPGIPGMAACAPAAGCGWATGCACCVPPPPHPESAIPANGSRQLIDVRQCVNRSMALSVLTRSQSVRASPSQTGKSGIPESAARKRRLRLIWRLSGSSPFSARTCLRKWRISDRPSDVRQRPTGTPPPAAARPARRQAVRRRTERVARFRPSRYTRQ